MEKKEKDTRQMPCQQHITSEKNYCDLLYAWIQCESTRVAPHSRDRFIFKDQCKFTHIERAMTDSQGEKIMNRKTISKYFNWLIENGFLTDEGDRYHLTVLGQHEANIFEFGTLSVLTNVLKRHAIDIYQYLYGRYCAAKSPYLVTVSQIKKFIGIATATTSNNAIIMDTLDILKRLQLLDYKYVQTEEKKTNIEIQWVVNKLPVG